MSEKRKKAKTCEHKRTVVKYYECTLGGNKQTICLDCVDIIKSERVSYE